MSRKIARITQEKKLLLANKVVESNAKTSLNSDGRLEVDEIIEYPAELEGGRNLLRNSSFENGFSQWLNGFQNGLNYWAVSDNFSYHGNISACLMGRDSHYWRGVAQDIYDVSVGETYTASAFVKCDSGVTYGASMRIRISNDRGNTWIGVSSSTSKSENWTRISCSYTVENGVNALRFEFYSSTGNTVGKGVYVDTVKLEKGTQATDWTPAPEDLGLNYPNSIQNFNSSISGNNIITTEFIEGYPFVKPVIDDSLVLWLDGSTGNNYEQTGIWKDLSGNGNDGQLVNFGYTEGSGWADGGLKFDGVDDYVQLPDLDLNPDNFTIQVDDKIRAFNGDKVITENGDEWGRNLLKQVSDGNYSNVYRDVIIQDGIMYWKQIGTATAPFAFYLYDTTLKTDDFVFSFKTNQIQKLRPFIYADGKTLSCSPVIVEHEDYYHVSMIFKNITISNSVFFYGTEPFEPPKEVQFWDFKLEKGSMATPWTPAPEDITETNIINHNTLFVENNTIHTLRFYNRALTDEEILQNYQAGQCSPLLAMRGEVIG